MQTVLITGAYGFIGTNLSFALKDKYTLWALDLSENSGNYSRYFSWKDLEILPWNEVDIVIHLAGKAHDTKNKSDAQSYFDINTGLTQTVFNKYLSSKTKVFIFLSSVKAVADSVNGKVLTESATPNPHGPYGESKLKAERYIQSQDITGRNVYIIRPCMIHGPGNKGNLNLLYHLVKRNIPYPLGAFNNQRSYLNIWNLSWVIEQLITKLPNNGIYHLADDDPLSTNILIKLIAESLGKKVKIWKCNKKFVSIVARIGNICMLPFNTDRLQKLTENYVVSNIKIKEALNINKLPVDVITGLRETLITFKNGN